MLNQQQQQAAWTTQSSRRELARLHACILGCQTGASKPAAISTLSGQPATSFAQACCELFCSACISFLKSAPTSHHPDTTQLWDHCCVSVCQRPYPPPNVPWHTTLHTVYRACGPLLKSCCSGACPLPFVARAAIPISTHTLLDTQYTLPFVTSCQGRTWGSKGDDTALPCLAVGASLVAVPCLKCGARQSAPP